VTRGREDCRAGAHPLTRDGSGSSRHLPARGRDRRTNERPDVEIVDVITDCSDPERLAVCSHRPSRSCSRHFLLIQVGADISLVSVREGRQTSGQRLRHEVRWSKVVGLVAEIDELSTYPLAGLSLGTSGVWFR
jgi:hypothetical protein